MKRLRKKMSFILFCLGVSFLSSGCEQVALLVDGSFEAIEGVGKEFGDVWGGIEQGCRDAWADYTPRSDRGQPRPYDPFYDINQMEMQMAVRESERQAREEELKTHLYIQGLRGRLLQQELQRQLNQKRPNR